MNAKSRFSDRVENYIKYRPGYPDEKLLNLIQLEMGFTPDDVVADIGSGTGISARLFLEYGNVVYCVEPNEPMRKAAEAILHEYANFYSVHGSSDATNIESDSIDLIICAQAFHWFDREATKTEFRRIATSNAHLCLIWNDRKCDAPFQQDYEQLIQDFAIDYNEISHRNITEEIIDEFYKPHPFKKYVLYNEQRFDLKGLVGRIISSSYMPNEDSTNFEVMKAAIIALFNKHQKNGEVTFEYDTKVYLGRVK